MKKILAALLVFAAIVLLGCTENPFDFLNPPDQNTPPVGPPINPDANLPVDCLIIIGKQRTSSVCESLSSQDLKDNCYSDFAELDKNPFFCDNIQEQVKKQACYASNGNPADFAFCGSPNPDNNAPNPNQQIPAECLSFPEGTQRDNCIKDIAKQTGSTVLCGFLKIISPSDCLLEVAIEKKDASICFQVSNQTQKNSCLYTIGMANSDELACKAMAEPNTDATKKRDECLKKAAVAKKSQEICASMSASYEQDHYVRDECYWEIFSSTKDGDICANFISKQKKDDCLAQLSESPEAIQDCRLLSSDKNINACILKVILETEDYKQCKEITDANTLRTCYLGMSEFFDPLSDDSLCLEMIRTEEKDFCYNKLADATSDFDYCLKINSTTIQDKCLSNIGIKNKDASICEKILITDPEPWDNCFYELGTEQKDANLCLKIRNQQKMADCVFGVAVSSSSLNICKIFPNNYVSSYSKFRLDMLCYKNYSIEKDDIFICEMISDSNIHQACIDQNSDFR